MWMPSRTPRRPSIGFGSRRRSTAPSKLRLPASKRPILRVHRLELDDGSQLGDLLQQLVVGRQELVQRRVDQPDGDRQPVHRLEEPAKSARCSGSSSSRASRRSGSSRARIMRLHHRQPLGLEEHVLGAAQADALGPERARALGVRAGSRRWPGRPAGGTRRPSRAASISQGPRVGGASCRAARAKTSPVVPSTDTQSPSRTHRGRRVARLLGSRPPASITRPPRACRTAAATSGGVARPAAAAGEDALVRRACRARRRAWSRRGPGSPPSSPSPSARRVSASKTSWPHGGAR